MRNSHYRFLCVNTHPSFQALLGDGDQADAKVQKKVILGDKTRLLLFRSLETFTNLGVGREFRTSWEAMKS